MRNSLPSLLDELFDQMFVSDKNERTVFFPWGYKKQGYFIGESLASKVKKFYKTSFFVCFILIIIAIVVFRGNSWGKVGTIVIGMGGWYLVYLLYVLRIVKSLQPVKTNYADLILEKHESEESKNYILEEQSNTQYPAQWSKPIPSTRRDPFLGLKIFLLRLPPGQFFILFFFFGAGIFAVYINIIKHGMWERPFDFLLTFLVCVICGFASFIFAKNMDVGKKQWVIFIDWKLPPILMTVTFGGLAIYCLYKFIFMILVRL